MRECIEEVWLPQCLEMEIDYNTFWRLNPKLVKIHAKVFKNKQEEKRATINFNAWLHGIYMRDAIASCLSKSATYPDKPIELTAKKLSAKENAELFSDFASAWNTKFIKEHKEGQ